MTKRNWLILLIVALIIFIIGLTILGVIFIPRLLGNTIIENVNNSCEMSNCHGLDVKCGINSPLMCTMEYQIGDNCRKFATCEKNGSICELKESPEFVQCKMCVENCIKKYKSSYQIAEQFSCADNCPNIENNSTTK